jgi:hypothetical protein
VCYKKRFICINRLGMLTPDIQGMFADLTRQSMGLNRLRGPGMTSV